MDLRGYQVDAVRAVQRDWSDGHTDVLGVAAVGSGKTCIFLALVVEELTANPNARALILAHREELIYQPIERLYQFWPEWKGRAGAVMAEYDECDRRITVATVQTLSQNHRLQKLLAHGAIDYLVTDECFHAIARTYQDLYAALRAANPNLKHLGVTATPMREDGHGMVEVYQKQSFLYGLREMISSGWLVPPRWLAIQTQISLKGVKCHDGDYSAKSLADVFECDNCFDLVVESHKKYAQDRQMIAFTPTVNGAYRLAENFQEAGIPAQAADATTPRKERAAILNAFRSGTTQVLVNVGIFTEGLDIPQTNGIHMVRPTKSDALYQQCIGRALRLAPGKEDALILDYAPLEARNLVMMGDVLGVDARKDAYIKDSEEEGEVIGGFTFDQHGFKWLEGNPMEIISRQLDYLQMSAFAWHKGPDGWLTLGLGEGEDKIERTLAISAPDKETGNCHLYLVAKREGERMHQTYLVMTDTFEACSEKADWVIARRQNMVLAARNRSWRKQCASSKQMNFAQRLGVWQTGMSKGLCAEAITHKLALRAILRH